MVILLTAGAFLIIGYAIVGRIASQSPVRPFGSLERATYASIAGTALWLVSTWALALTRTLTPAALGVRALIVVAVAVVLLVRMLRGRSFEFPEREPLVFVTLVPLLVLTAFAVFRAQAIPPVSHDALSYHLPKAVLFARAEGFRYLSELDARQASIPTNYELLLTEMVVLDGRDDWTEVPSVAFYLLFIVACGALAEQWWRDRRAALTAMLAVAATPVALLHSFAHKNDLMTAFFAIGAMVAAGRWMAGRNAWSLLFLIAAVGAGVGTKPQVAMLALALAPVIAVQAARALRPRILAAIVVFGITAFLLLGGATYVTNVLREQNVVAEAEGESVIMYGDWRNLWEGPYVLLAAPFSKQAKALFVPWEQSPWFWQRYEIYFSHLGIPFALCAVGAPFGILLLRRRTGARERVVVTFAALAAFGVMLPVIFKPHGMYAISLPRYALFIVPVVFGWTIAPLAARSVRAATGLTAVLLAFFAFYAFDNVKNDAFAPLEYVLWARENPGTREIPFHSGRAASAVDRLAGPDDSIAFDAGYASWIHPAFGARLSRPVSFIPAGDGPPTIPDDAKWVVVDRSWGIFWGAGEDRDLSEAREYLMRGQPSPAELRVRRHMLRDNRFRVAYVQLGTNQVVFERVR